LGNTNFEIWQNGVGKEEKWIWQNTQAFGIPNGPMH
jgi:hypothetical protein